MSKWEVGSVYRNGDQYFLVLDDSSTTWFLTHSIELGLHVSPIGDREVQSYQRVRGFAVEKLLLHWGMDRLQFDRLVLQYLKPYRFQEVARARAARLPLLLKKILLSNCTS